MPPIDMKAGDVLTVILELDWQTNMSKDFSITTWGTGSEEVTISKVTSQTKDSQTEGWPLTERTASDMNAA